MAGSSCNTRTNDTHSSRVDELDLHVDKLRFVTSVHSEKLLIHPREGDKRWRPLKNFSDQFEGTFEGPNGSSIWLRTKYSSQYPEDQLSQPVTVEFNPSHFVYGSASPAGVSIAQVPRVLETLRGYLRSSVIDMKDDPFARVQRVDLAADFELDGVPPGFITRSLETVHRSRRTTVTAIRSGGGAATLYVEPGLKKANSGRAWKFRLYSKAELDPSDAKLRAELELRYRGLRNLGVTYLCDLADFHPGEAFHDYWERYRLGVPIVDGSRLWAALSAHAERTGMHRREIGNAYGYAYSRDVAGTSGEDYSANLRRKYENFLTDAGCDAIAWEDPVSGHLDLGTLKFEQTATE